MRESSLAWRAHLLLSRGGILALAVLLLCTSAIAQTPPKKHGNLFDDDPKPAKGDPVPARPAPGAAEMAPGMLFYVHQGSTTDGAVTQSRIMPNLGVAFTPRAVPEIVDVCFSFRGAIQIPPGKGRGIFSFETTGESELTIDGEVVSSKVVGDAAHTFNHQVNLAPGMHTLTARIYRLHGTGTLQESSLLWDSGGRVIQVPTPWYFHAKADEAPGMEAIKQEAESLGASGGTDSGWVAAGTMRPPDQAALPNDVLARVILADYQGNSHEKLKRFTTIPIAGFKFAITSPRTNPNNFWNQSFKLIGVLRLDADCTCAFDCQVVGQATVTIDGRIVSRITNPGESTKESIRLNRGNHAFELAISKIKEEMGAHMTGLGWSVNGAPFTEVPIEVLAHYRAQEPYANNIATGPGGGDLPAASVPVPAAAPAPQPMANLVAMLDAAGKEEWQRLQPALARLAEHPNDPVDNLAVGRFYCFTARDWERGAAALALSGDPVFAWLGRHEAAASAGPSAQMTVANGWWDAADGQPDAMAALMRQRAAHWYSIAAPNLTGLSQRVAQRRLTKVQAVAKLSSGPAISNQSAPQPHVARVIKPPHPALAADGPLNGPIIIVIDRSVATSEKVSFVCERAAGILEWMPPKSAVIVTIVDASPRTLNLTLEEVRDADLTKSRLRAALESAPPTPAGATMEDTLTSALKLKPARLFVFIKSHVPLERLATWRTAQDPKQETLLFVHYFGVGSDLVMQERMRTYRYVLGPNSGMTLSGIQLPARTGGK